MINFLDTIAASVSKYLLEVRKHAYHNKREMRTFMVAIILLDMIEWSNYINTDETKENKKHLMKLLKWYMLKCDSFIIKRF